MSWGERDCKDWGDCKIANMGTCNKSCEYYTVNKDHKAIEAIAPPSEGGPTIVRSTNERYNKKEDMIVLKGDIFEIQSLSPKKMILRLKKNLTESNRKEGNYLPDGVFCFSINGKVQPVAKILRENRISIKNNSKPLPLAEEAPVNGSPKE